MDLRQRLFDAYNHIYYYKEISYLKQIQKINYETYLNSICNEDAIYHEYKACIKGLDIEYIPYKLPQKNCDIMLMNEKTCIVTKNELRKAFEIKQKKYIDSTYFPKLNSKKI